MAYIRKTTDEYELLKNYGYGFETVTTELTRKDIKERKKEYELNEGGYFKIKHVRVKIAQ